MNNKYRYMIPVFLRSKEKKSCCKKIVQHSNRRIFIFHIINYLQKFLSHTNIADTSIEPQRKIQAGSPKPAVEVVQAP